MDKILLIDGMNQMWRASIGFGKTKHELCLAPTDDNGVTPPCNGYWCGRDKTKPHCSCGATWISEENTCFAEKYVIVFNFFRNLRPLIEQFQPDKCFFVLEGHAQFRYDLFPEYKANRKIVKTAAKQEELDRFYPQKDIIVNLIKNFPLTIVKALDYECDDVIATLVSNMSNEDITILSSDTDFIQLLQAGHKNCKIYNPITKKFYADPGYHYVAWKCLCGDTADNIPGFKGIGDKTAQKMLADPAKFEKFMSLEENRANFNIYKSLIEFRSIPLELLIIEECKANWAAIKQSFTDMEFNSIVNDKSWGKYITTFDCIKY